MNEDTNSLINLVKESFDPKLIVALFSNFSDKYVALEELIDNSIDDRVNGVTLEIYINYQPNESKIVIKNLYGKGMNLDSITKFFSWGYSEKSAQIGRYGQGGKAAIGYLGKGFVMKSHPVNSKYSYVVKVDDWQDRTNGFKEVSIRGFQVLEDRSSVIFEINSLNYTFDTDKIKSKISEIYRPLIIDHNVVFYVETEKIKCIPTKYDDNTEHKININFEHEGNQYHLIGHCGIVSDAESPRGGMSVYVHGRRVAYKEYFGHTDPSRRWNTERFYGELYINFPLPLLMNKTDVQRSSSIWKKIYEVMHTEINNTLNEAIDYKSPRAEEIKIVEKINKKATGGEKEKNFEVSLGSYGHDVIFKTTKFKDGERLTINRNFRSYPKWAMTDHGKKLFTVLAYSLSKVSQQLPKKESSRLISLISKIIDEYSEELL